MRKKHIVLLSIAIIFLVAVIWMIWGNTSVGLTSYTICEANLPEEFDGYQIAHVSDLHNSWLWKKTLQHLRKANPDIICITGDIVDSNKTDVQRALDFASEAVKIAPCYYVTGNHELRLPADQRDQLWQGLRALGVIVLFDEEIILEKNGDQIALVGHKMGNEKDVADLSDFDGYRILLSHRPEYFEDYVSGEYEIVLSGHAHGGQVRLPLLGGVIAPGQGLFPTYDSGIYTQGCTDMVVNRGVGNSRFPIRFANRPEVILITLQCV